MSRSRLPKSRLTAFYDARLPLSVRHNGFPAAFLVFYVKQTISVHSSMSSLADASDLVGFFSYSREDDEGSGGKLSKLRERIQEELRGQLGRTKRDFRLWQDKVAIAPLWSTLRTSSRTSH